MIQSESEKLLVEQQKHVIAITINNPSANTWDRESLSELRRLVEACNADRDVYAITITGKGDKFFSAGADLKMFADGDPNNAGELAQLFGEAFETLSQFRGVSIAAVNGYAMGGGLECALACDIRICETHSKMALPEASVGLLPCGGGTQNLAWLVGEGWAKRMILCGETVTAQKALEIGLVEEVCDTGESLSRALALAESVSKQSPPAVAACKSLIQEARRGNMASAYVQERGAFVDLFDTQDQKEGVNAFLEKRAPKWING